VAAAVEDAPDGAANMQMGVAQQLRMPLHVAAVNVDAEAAVGSGRSPLLGCPSVRGACGLGFPYTFTASC
jgi:hypothetical protein